MATQMDFETINQTAILLLVLYGLSAVLTYLQSYIMVTVTQKMSRTLRQEIVEKINRLPFSYFDKVSTGDVMSRITNDVDMVGHFEPEYGTVSICCHNVYWNTDYDVLN